MSVGTIERIAACIYQQLKLTNTTWEGYESIWGRTATRIFKLCRTTKCAMTVRSICTLGTQFIGTCAEPRAGLDVSENKISPFPHGESIAFIACPDRIAVTILTVLP
jgi:hypothetical protein